MAIPPAWLVGVLHGRELESLTEGGVTWTNTYNADGLRISRSNSNLTYKYYYSGGQLVRLELSNGECIDFSYDASGVPMSLYYSVTNENYYYVTNLQGDVVAILDDDGIAVATYIYDAWGNIIDAGGSMETTLGAYNPLRYRGYVYDQETSLYYLQSRYYDPNMGRFLNADAFTTTGQGLVGNNMFAYCGNNPVKFRDPTGQFFVEIFDEFSQFVEQVVEAVQDIVEKITEPPTQEEMAFAATIYTEAAGENYTTKQAVAHVMNNRIDTNGWENIVDVVSAEGQFSGYNNVMYNDAILYYQTGQWDNPIESQSMDKCMQVALSITRWDAPDITGGALFFHSKPNPEDWRYHYDFTQVYVEGTEGFFFYK